MTADLTGALKPGSPGAGQRYADIVLTNTGDHDCTVFGYGGGELRASDGTEIPTNFVRDESTAPQLITVSPGSSVSSQLHWSVVPGSGDQQGVNCQPVATTLAVTPPDETTVLDIPWNEGPVCEQGRIDQQPYVAH